MSPIRALKYRPHVGYRWVDAVEWMESALALRTALLFWVSSMRQVSTARGPRGYLFSPAWMVQGMCLPATGVNAEVFEGGFQAVFEALLLSYYSLFTLAQLAKQNLF